MKHIITILILLLAGNGLRAQFLSQGKITYERKTNLRQKIQTEEGNEWAKDHLKDVAQFTLSEFSMVFNKDAALYKFEKDPEVVGWTLSWGGKPAGKNTVYTDFNNKIQLAEKEVYENKYFLNDTTPKFQWKILSEIRMIAGYPCRKAITKICDSVVVVAFYCDEIMVSGGPESFNGLPGMILGVAIPRLYTTWFATNVEVLPQDAIKPIKQEKKTKNTTTAAMISEIKKNTEDWGEWGNAAQMPWWLTL